MNSAEIREAFLSYFERKEHTRVPSSSLVPGNDPTLLFTNAGMVQFKDVFLGDDKRSYSRATSSQRCVRAGGKHNDLENVGYTARHHTFFEMLGNFSFGDYFKHDAIHFAWEFLTSDQWLNLPAQKLLVTVYAEDDEAYAIWHDSIGLSEDKIIRIGDNKGGKYQSDNFWSMGDTGPCGPCSEIFYDHGEHIFGGPPGSADEDGDRFIEIWNNVFMQYNRSADGSMSDLPAPSVDTGMGLERISAIMQGVHSNYEIDLFQNLLAAAAKLLKQEDPNHTSLKVIADHIRSCAFLISDSVIPSNEGRGYVLRRIARRAIRHGNKLGATEPFFYKLVAPLAKEMGEAYPELVERQAQLEKVLRAEEEQFAKTLDQGMRILEEDLASLSGKEISGETVFKLYDTYGFPVDLTGDIARERDLTMDMAGFEAAMAEQKARARAGSSFAVGEGKGTLDPLEAKAFGSTEFNGYESLQGQVRVVGLYKGGEVCDQLGAGDKAIVILQQTPFYGESGGQVGDTGVLTWNGGRFDVKDTQKQGDIVLHVGVVVEGSLAVNDAVHAEVGANERQATALNHSATHLLHAALRQVLGEHVQQKGSLVDSDKLRFDFSHFEAVTLEQLDDIDRLVNQKVRENSLVSTQVMSMDAAKEQGAMALFGEKYADDVRVLSMADDFSIELCGGTHVKRTGDIGIIKIISESGISAGVRRIEALTGGAALASVKEQDNQLKQVAAELRTGSNNVLSKVRNLNAEQKKLEKEVAALKSKLASASGDELSSKAKDINGIKVLAEMIEGADPKTLRDTVDQLKNKLGSAVVIVATIEGEKISLAAGVTKDITAKYKAGDLMKYTAEQIGGKGGGRPDMAQGGGSDIASLPTALNAVFGWVEARFD